MSQKVRDQNFTKGYAPAHGLEMYYEIHGEGRPLVLLHGSYMNIDINWSRLIPEFAKSRKVIALEMQGHGRTADIDRPYSYAAFADDVVALLKHLEIDSADILGYSLGGTVALEVGIRHPDLTNRIVVISSVFNYDGWIQAVRDVFPTIQPESLEQTPLKAEYDRLAPNPDDWPNFVTKLARFVATPFDLGADNIKALKTPVLYIIGDNDGVDLKHVAELYGLVGGGVFGDMAGLPESQLAVVPGTTHVSLMMETQKLATLIRPFLDGQPVASQH